MDAFADRPDEPTHDLRRAREQLLLTRAGGEGEEPPAESVAERVGVPVDQARLGQ
jgi:hypothetical protein